MVELMTRYSNNPTLLKNARQTVLAPDEDDESELGGGVGQAVRDRGR
jgi:hypothetical protein